MGKLAITGGEPVRKTPFTPWPVATKEEFAALEAAYAPPAADIKGAAE